MKDFLKHLSLIAVAGFIWYVFFNELVGIALFIGVIFLLVNLSEKNEKNSAATKSEQVPHVGNSTPRTETVSRKVSSEFYRINELQSQFEKWLNAVENAHAENKWKYGRDYERYVGYLFERETFHVIYNGATKGSSDGGIDLFCFK